MLDCDTCRELLPDPVQRAGLRCGWLPESQWTDGARPFPRASVCPGYMEHLPDVNEAVRAMRWFEAGGLSDLYDEPLTDLVRDLVEIVSAAVKRVDREAAAEATNGLR